MVHLKSPPYDIGDELEFRAIFRDKSDNNADPTNVTFLLVCPDHTRLTWDYPLTITRLATGIYTVTCTIDNGSGFYRWVWRGTGVRQITKQGRIFVEALP